MSRNVRIGDVAVVTGTGWDNEYLIEDIISDSEGHRITIVNADDHTEVIIMDQNGSHLENGPNGVTIGYLDFDPSRYLLGFPIPILRRILRNRLAQHINDVPDTYAFAGEEDSSQTEFEKLSNQMQIGVHVPQSLVAPSLFVLRAHVDNNWDLLNSFLDYGIGPEENDYPRDGDFLPFATWSANSNFNDYGTSGPVLSDLSVRLRDSRGTYEVRPNDNTKIYTIADLIDMAFRDIGDILVKSAGKR